MVSRRRNSCPAGGRFQPLDAQGSWRFPPSGPFHNPGWPGGLAWPAMTVSRRLCCLAVVAGWRCASALGYFVDTHQAGGAERCNATAGSVGHVRRLPRVCSSTPPCPAAALPAAWKTCFDEEMGCDYYFNPHTGVSSWNAPPCPAHQAGPALHETGVAHQARTHPEDTAVALQVRPPEHVVEGQEFAFEVGVWGLEQGVKYGVLATLQSGPDVIFEDGWFLDSGGFTGRLPALDQVVHTRPLSLRVTVVNVLPGVPLHDTVLSESTRILNVIPRQQPAPSSRRILFFLHLHKSGGSTFCTMAGLNNVITTNANCVVQTDQRCCGGDTLEEQADFARSTPLQLVASESYMYLEMDTEHYEYIILLRRSLSRYHSHYQHAVAAHNLTQQDLSFEEWMDGQPDNWNTRHICGTLCRDVPKYALTRDHLDFTMARLESFSHFLFLERFQETFTAFARKVNWSVTSDVSRHRRGTRFGAKTLDSAKFKPMTYLDDFLYTFASALHDTNKTIVFEKPADEELDDVLLACGRGEGDERVA